MASKCFECANKNVYEPLVGDFVCGEEHCVKFSHFVPRKPNTIRKPMTNADRIRAMTDEELADFINDAEFGFLDRPGICAACHTHRMKDCLSCWLDWLNAEAEGE